MTLSLLGLGAVLVLVFLRMPIAIAMGLVGFLGFIRYTKKTEMADSLFLGACCAFVRTSLFGRNG